jgi:hypothetical protein
MKIPYPAETHIVAEAALSATLAGLKSMGARVRVYRLRGCVGHHRLTVRWPRPSQPKGTARERVVIA